MVERFRFRRPNLLRAVNITRGCCTEDAIERFLRIHLDFLRSLVSHLIRNVQILLKFYVVGDPILIRWCSCLTMSSEYPIRSSK